MSYASWAHVNPSSGSGNSSTSWTADANTGRSERKTTASYSAGSITRAATIKQAGAPLSILLTSPSGTQNQQGGGSSDASASNTGRQITLQGTTNAKKLTYSIRGVSGYDYLDITLPSNYTANSNSTANGAAISGDPGATAAFNFSIPLTIPANTSTSSLKCKITIQGEDENSNTVDWDVTITSEAGDAYLYIGTASGTTVTVNLNNTGTAQTVSVFSNTSWTIS